MREDSVLSIVLLALSGLVLFLYAVSRLSLTLRRVATERAKELLARSTGSVLAAVATGTVVTTLLDSSSAVIILVIALVSAGALPFRNSLGVVLGANIGTTISSQLFAFDIGAYAVVAMLPGLLLLMLGKKKQQRRIGQAVFCFGLLFFSLYLIGEAVAPLKSAATVRSWLLRLENPLRGAATGALVTLLIQSSSATVGIAIELCSKNLLTLPAGVAVMLGAELGTCSDTLLATAGRGRPALRTALFHLSFNLLTIALGLLLLPGLVELVHLLADRTDVARQLAHVHVLFNTLGVLLFLPLVPWAARQLEKLLPDAAAAE